MSQTDSLSATARQANGVESNADSHAPLAANTKSGKASPVAPAATSPVENRLLATLPDDDRRRLFAIGEQVRLRAGEVLCEPGEPIQHVYFPANGFVSKVIAIDQGAKLEVELVGNEGMVGASLLLGVGVSPMRALVQGSGMALRIKADAFCAELETRSALRRTMNRYLYVLLAQLAQTAACNRFHVLDARLALCLLMTHDRAHSDAFHITHEVLAQMLGVRRVGVTNAAGLLQKRKLVSYCRGDITVLDRAGLEAVCCGCYRAVKDTYEQIFGHHGALPAGKGTQSVSSHASA